MKWEKRGLIYCANHAQEWAISHAAMPTPYLLNDKVLRIYCAFRAKKTVSRIGYVDVLAADPREVIGVSEKPLLDIGMPGTFDDNGVMPVSVVSYAGKLYLYYGGFELGMKMPYTLYGGLAVSEDGGNSFKRYQRTPITDRSDTELFFRTASYVIHDDDLWKMWYIAGSGWVEQNGKKLSEYEIKYMESYDGIAWSSEGHVCISRQDDEFGFGRPYVIKHETGYKMYYSIRTLSKGYRLGYAESADGRSWIRKDDELGLDVTPNGPDSTMMCYSAFFSHQNKDYLFYNGNDYGGTGILFAELIT